MFKNKKITQVTASLAALSIATVAFTGCASNEEKAVGTDESSHSQTDVFGNQMHTHDAWVRSAAKGEMTALFAEIHNEADAEVVIESASSDVAESVELHEVVNGAMQEVSGGIKLGKGETVALEPGGLHIMLMGLQQDLKAGDEVTVTLTLSDGSAFELTAPVRDSAAGDEEYHSDHDHEHEDEEGHSH